MKLTHNLATAQMEIVCRQLSTPYHISGPYQSMRFEAHPRVSAGIEEEGRLLCGGVDVVVVGKLHQGEECVPVVLSFSEKEPQVLF